MNPFDLFLRLHSFASDPIFSFIYDTNGRMTYAGISQKGALKSQAKWKVIQYTLDGDGRTTDVRVSNENVIFNDYATLTYY